MTTEEYDKKINEVWKKKDQALNDSDLFKQQEFNFVLYEEIIAPYDKLLGELSRKKRMQMEPILDREIPDYGDRMTLEHFIECVDCGGFIDYDGSGTYIKDEMMTSISIYPSDVKHKAIRKEFKEIIWFNR